MHADVSFVSGLREIAKGIKESKSLKTLRIGPLRRVCSPTDSGGEAILAACSDPHCSVNRLEFVRLAFNSVIGKHFWKYLPKTKIKTLLLEGDPIGEEGVLFILCGSACFSSEFRDAWSCPRTEGLQRINFALPSQIRCQSSSFLPAVDAHFPNC